jgi:hypothetical protein
MANDQNRDQNRNLDQNRDQKTRDRTIGEGMNSPDSTQMPLKASTGEPDWETQTNRNAGGGGGNTGGGNTGNTGGGDRSQSSDASASTPRGGRQNTGGDSDT